ncbi:MAG: hypothetical protein LBJ74_00665 [Heliobacteriaceae bacterium]|jgi:hypothetical protein|nr:hypothetical protein [Heliobacteriaceae bacterium]
MQILGQNPRLTPNFSGRMDRVDALINASDYELQKKAYKRTAESIDTEHHKKVSNALFYSIPLVAGTAAFLLSKGNSKFFGKQLSGTAGKLASGIKSGAWFGAAIGAVTLFGCGTKKLRENSPAVREFEDKNPLLSFVAKVGVAIGALSLGSKGIYKLGRQLKYIGHSANRAGLEKRFSKGTKRLADAVKPKFINNVQNKTGKAADKINGNSTIAKVVDGVHDFFGKAPAPIKNIGKTVLAWSPVAVLLGGFFHDVDHHSVKNREFARNYNNLKSKQENLTRTRMHEISKENLALAMKAIEFAHASDALAEENCQLKIQLRDAEGIKLQENDFPPVLAEAVQDFNEHGIEYVEKKETEGGYGEDNMNR